MGLSRQEYWSEFPGPPPGDLPNPGINYHLPLVVKSLPANDRDIRDRFNPWVGKMPWRRPWQPTPVFLPGESMDRGAWRAMVHRVAESWTRLKWLSTLSWSLTYVDHQMFVVKCEWMNLQSQTPSLLNAFPDSQSKDSYSVHLFHCIYNLK